MTNNNLQNTTQTPMIEQQKPNQKLGVNSGAMKG